LKTLDEFREKIIGLSELQAKCVLSYMTGWLTSMQNEEAADEMWSRMEQLEDK